MLFHTVLQENIVEKTQKPLQVETQHLLRNKLFIMKIYGYVLRDFFERTYVIFGECVMPLNNRCRCSVKRYKAERSRCFFTYLKKVVLSNEITLVLPGLGEWKMRHWKLGVSRRQTVCNMFSLTCAANF